MARRCTRGGRTISRRRDGVVAISGAARRRRTLVLVAGAALALPALLFTLAFLLPLPLLPIPPLALGVAWLLYRSARAQPQPSRAQVIALRSARRRRAGRPRS